MTKKSIFRAFMLMAISFMVSGTFVSCSDDEVTEDNAANSSIVGKWEVGDSGAEYGSFEFTNDSKYIITQRVSSPPAGARSLRAATADQQPVYIIIIFGDYSQLNNNGNLFELDLKEFGTISATLGDDGKSITIIVNGETYTASKTAEMPSNDKTDLLCHTWKFKECEIIESLVPKDEKEWLISEYGSDWKAKEEKEWNDFYKGVTMTFTKAGTYFVSNPNDDDFNAQWEWENISKGTMKYYISEDGEIYSGVVTVTVTSTTFEVLEDYMITKLVRQ
jgi:hypothetical protein